MKNKIQKQAWIGPIYVAEFSNDGKLIFAGVGPYFCVFEVCSGKILARQHVFEGGYVRGIVKKSDSCIAIFGQKTLKMCLLNLEKHPASTVQLGADKALFRTLKSKHNTPKYGLMYYSSLTGQAPAQQKGENARQISVESEIQCKDWILNVQFLDDEMIAVGLAHNCVEIYKECKLLKTIQGMPNCLLYSLSFFGTSLDNLVVASGTIFKQVVIWDLNGKKQILSGHEGVIFRINWSHDGSLLCSCSDDRTVRLWEIGNNETTKPALTMYGHSARVWDCKILKDFIISCGEDVTVRVWDYKGNCVHVFQGHLGKNVWRIAIDPKQQLIASCGHDSTIKLWPLDTLRKKLSPKAQEEYHKKYILPGFDCTSKFDSKAEFVRCVCVHNNDLFIASNRGYIYRIENDKFVCLYDGTKDKTFIICMDVSPNGKLLAIGNLNGRFKLLDLKTLQLCDDIQAFNDRITQFWWHSDSCLFVGGMKGQVKKYNFQNENKLVETHHFNTTHKQRVTALCYIEAPNIILLGDGKGTVFLFRITTDTKVSPIQIYKHAHKDKISQILFQNMDCIYSIGRDGQMSVFEIRNEKLMQLTSHKLSYVIPSLEKIYITKESEIILFGFYGDYIIAYNFSSKYRFASFECGGPKSIFSMVYDGNSFVAAVTLNQAIHLFRHVKDNITTKESLYVQFHPRDVYAVEIWKTKKHTRIITASEDTLIRVLEYEGEFKLNHLCTMQNHESSVHALSLSPQSDNQVFLFSGGGKGQLNCWKIVDTGSSVRSDLLQSVKTMREANYRILSICSFLVKMNHYCVIAGTTDARLKIYIYDSEKNILSPIAEAENQRPVTALCHVQHRDKFLVCSGATDGYIRIWDLTKLLNQMELVKTILSPLFSLKVHQSAVNALHYHIIHEEKDCEIHFVTGGDDQAISYCKLQVGSDCKQLKLIKLENQHSAAVNGIFTDGKIVISTSLDHRLNFYALESMKMESSHMIEMNVLDIDVSENVIALAGSGLQVLTYNK